jgi:hypothetical protein
VALCQGYALLMQESINNFDSISGAETKAPEGLKRYKSKLEIKDASDCFIERSPIGNEWFAYFGSFTSKDAAVNKIKSIQLELLSCVSHLEFLEKTNLITQLPYYTMKENFNDGFSIHKLELGIIKSEENNFMPFMKVPEPSNIVTYRTLTNTPDTTTFGKELGKILIDAKSGFKDILGDKSKGGTYSLYKTNYCITGSYGCLIEDNRIGKKFKSLAATGLSLADADKALEILSSSVASAIGDKFVYSKTKDGMRITFSDLNNVDSVDNCSVAVEKEKVKGDKFNILIIIKEQNKAFKF